MEKDKIVYGFWIENFGEIEISYFPDKEIEQVDTSKRISDMVKIRMLEKTEEIFTYINTEQIRPSIQDLLDEINEYSK